MLRILIIVFIFVALAAQGAEYPEVSDKIGLFYNEFADYSCDSGSPSVPIDLFVVLLNPSFENLYAWEAAVHVIETQCLIFNSTVFGGGTNSLGGGEFKVAYIDPLPTSSVTVLGSVSIMPLEHECCMILTGISNPSLPEQNPLVWPTPGAPIAIETNDFLANGVDAIMGQCPWIPEYPDHSCQDVVSQKEQNWGTLKSMYR